MHKTQKYIPFGIFLQIILSFYSVCEWKRNAWCWKRNEFIIYRLEWVEKRFCCFNGFLTIILLIGKCLISNCHKFETILYYILLWTLMLMKLNLFFFSCIMFAKKFEFTRNLCVVDPILITQSHKSCFIRCYCLLGLILFLC